MATHFEDTDIHYAYKCIRSFFNHFGLSDAVSYLESTLQAVTTYKIWKKEDPAQLLLFMELLTELIDAALVINYSYYTREDAIIKMENQPGTLTHEHYVSNYSDCNPWNCFPRSLTIKQYYNPYKAIKKFAACMAVQQWKTFIEDCTEYALRKATIADVHPAYNVLSIRRRLLQLIEACHLIDVRTNLKKAGL